MSFDLYHLSTFLGAFIFSTLLIWRIRFPLWLPYAYFLYYSMAMFMISPIHQVNTLTLGLQLASGRWFITLALFPLIFHIVDTNILSIVRRSLLIVLLFDAIAFMFGGKGIFIGDTQDVLIFATFAPLIGMYAYPIFLPVIALIHGVGSFVVLYVQLACIFWRYARQALIPLAVAAPAIFYLVKPKLLSRADFYIPYIQWWMAHANPLVGTGPGSFEWISMSQDGINLTPRMWMHSDWMQITFETGLIGLVAALTVYFYVLWQSRNNFTKFIVWISLGIAMCLYSPIQFWLVQFLAAGIISEATKKEI